jgi:hypothetical protein
MRSLVQRTIIINAENRCAGAYRFAHHTSVSQHVLVTAQDRVPADSQVSRLLANLDGPYPGAVTSPYAAYDSQLPNSREWSTRI